MNEPLGPLTLVLLAIPAVALRLAVRALYGRQSLASADPMQTMLSLSSTILFVMAGLGLIVGLLGLWFLMIPLPIVFVILVLMTIDRLRHSEHRALVWSLSAAAQKGVPLSEAARAFADETMGDTGLRALALAEAIERGEPLDQAVRSARLRMGTAMKLAVRVGERLGLLGPAMKQQLDASHLSDSALRDAIARFFYLGNVTFFLVGVITFVMLRIVPVFQRMFEEFGLQLPETTVFVVSLSKWFVRHGWYMIGPFVTFLVPGFLVVGVLYYLGWLPRDLPLVWRLSKRFDGALVMRGLALAVRRGLPLHAGLRMVADCYPLSIVASRVDMAASRVEAGSDWCARLRDTGLIGRADAAVLAAAERAGNLEWALEEMAESALRRQTYWIQMGVNILFPAALIALAALVFLFVAGMFAPIVSLIEGLA